MAKAKMSGSGWHKESLRHRQAKLLGHTKNLRYSGIATKPINKNASQIFYYQSPDTNFNSKDLAIGTGIEMEHTTDPEIAKGIAKAHLKEDKNYYKKLIKMENQPAPPIEVSETTELPIQFRLTVPSTTDINKKQTRTITESY